MTTVTLTDFRSHASGMLTRVENGETLVVISNKTGAKLSLVGQLEHIHVELLQTAVKLNKPGTFSLQMDSPTEDVCTIIKTVQVNCSSDQQQSLSGGCIPKCESPKVQHPRVYACSISATGASGNNR